MRYLIITLSLILFSCGGGSQNQGETASDQSESSSSGGASCLSEITDPGQWFQKGTLATLVGESEESIEFQSNPKYNNCSFSWKNDRKTLMKMGTIEMEMPANNVVGITITNLDSKMERAEKLHKRSFSYEEYFDMYYTTTKKGEEQVKETLEKKGEEDKNAKAAKSLLDLAPTDGHGDVDGLGDKANKYIQNAPGLRETRLAVLEGNVVIQINADISEDDEKDLETAMSVAKGVLALCD